MHRLATCAGLLLVTWIVQAENWPQFRGPSGMGLAPEAHLPLHWGGSEKTNILWSSPLIGEGHASPIVWGTRLFVTTVRWPDSVTDRATVMPEHHVLCYSTTGGALLWDTQVPPGAWLRTDFRSGPGGGYAAPTPATDGRHVYVAFGSSVMAALDFEGAIVWRKEIEPHTFDVTLGSSPVLYDNTVILLCAMARKEDSRLLALDKLTGNVAWETPMPRTGFAHSTPLLIRVDDSPQLLVVASGGGLSDEGLQSFNPANGRRLWWCRAGGDAASPAYGNGVVYVDSGRGGPGIAVDPTGTGDVAATHVRWQVPQVPEAIGSPLIADGLVYRLHNPNILKCWKADTGEQVYAERLEGLTSTWASPVLDGDGHLHFATAGRSVVVQAGTTFDVLATNDLGDPNHASPAVVGNRLYLVGTRQVYAVGVRLD